MAQERLDYLDVPQFSAEDCKLCSSVVDLFGNFFFRIWIQAKISIRVRIHELGELQRAKYQYK